MLLPLHLELSSPLILLIKQLLHPIEELGLLSLQLIDSLHELLIQCVLVLELSLPRLLLLVILLLHLPLPCRIVQSKSLDLNWTVKCLTIELGSVFALAVDLVKLDDNGSQLVLTRPVVLAISEATVGHLHGSIFLWGLILTLFLHGLAHYQVV